MYNFEYLSCLDDPFFVEFDGSDPETGGKFFVGTNVVKDNGSMIKIPPLNKVFDSTEEAFKTWRIFARKYIDDWRLKNS